jgi:cytochrome c biogenesis protein
LSAQNRTFATSLWDFFCSLKLTIALLIILSITSIIGTVIQQGRTPEQYLQVYSERTYRLFEALNFFDMYNSWWFLSLLGIFSINLIACSIKRFPRVWKTVYEPVLVPSDSLYKTFSNLEEMVVPASQAQVREKITSYLTSRFAAPVVTEEGDKIHFFAQKGGYSRFGVYVTHLSILIILAGAMIGSIFGFKAYVNIVEGQQTDKVWARSGGGDIDLGFTVRADKFSVEFYEGTSRPKLYETLVTVIDNGQTVKDRRSVIVNDPLTYKGIVFYQSSYGPAGDPTFSFRIRNRATDEVAEITVRAGQRVALPGGGTFRVADFTPNYQAFGPAARVEVFPAEGGRPRSFVVIQAFPDFDVNRGGEHIFSMTDFGQRYFTGLQVAKDPGVWVVWLGCFLLIFGSIAAFCLSHRRVWVTVQPVGQKTGIKIGGSAHRNQPGFTIFFDDLKKGLKDELKG